VAPCLLPCRSANAPFARGCSVRPHKKIRRIVHPVAPVLIGPQPPARRRSEATPGAARASSWSRRLLLAVLLRPFFFADPWYGPFRTRILFARTDRLPPTSRCVGPARGEAEGRPRSTSTATTPASSTTSTALSAAACGAGRARESSCGSTATDRAPEGLPDAGQHVPRQVHRWSCSPARRRAEAAAARTAAEAGTAAAA
jgi:hypothetical protein